MLHRQPNQTGQVKFPNKCMVGLICNGIIVLKVNVCIHRYIFLFDKVVIVCKRKGYSYELKEIIELQSYKMSDDPMNNRDMKKVRAALDSEAKRLHRLISLAVRSPEMSGRAGNESPCVITANVVLLLKDFVDGHFRYTVEPRNDPFKYPP